jgi:hypothetical protein
MTVPATSQERMRILEDTEQMKAEVLRYVPLGPPCNERATSWSKMAFPVLSRVMKMPEGIFFACDIRVPRKPHVVLRAQIKMTYDHTGVTGVVVTSGFVGP